MALDYEIKTENDSGKLAKWSAGLRSSGSLGFSTESLVNAARQTAGAHAEKKGLGFLLSDNSFQSVVTNNTGLSRQKVQATMEAVDKFFLNNNYVNAGTDIGTEGLRPTLEHRYRATNLKTKNLEEITGDSILSLLEKTMKGMPQERIYSTATEIAAILSSPSTYNAAFGETRDIRDDERPLYAATGARAYGQYSNPNAGIEGFAAAVESFGASINAVAINNRLAVNVSILRNYSSTIDKLFPRVTDETNTVTFVIPSPAVFDLERMNNAKAEVRNHSEVALVNVHAEPGFVNSAPQAVGPNLNPANDDGATKRLDTVSLPGTITLVADGAISNLSNLSNNPNRYGYEETNHTDSIAEGGAVRGLVLQAKNKSTNATEKFLISVAGKTGSRYIITNNQDDSGDCIVSLREIPFFIGQNTLGTDGKATQIFAALGKANIQIKASFTSNLRLKYCNIDGIGSAVAKAIPAVGVSAAAAQSDVQDAQKMLDNIEFSIVSFDPDLYFNEENLRKTTISLRINYLQKSFTIPQGRNYTVDTALNQPRDDLAIEAVQTAMSIGNSDRGMAVIESMLEETADAVATAKLNPEIYQYDRLKQMSFAATLCRPYVLRATANYEQLDVAVMRESERLSDKHAKVSQILLNGLSNVCARSLYLTSLNQGERVVFKALMHTTTADLLFSIPSYHPTLEDAVPKANGADYSFVLDNGFRIDVVKTNFHNWQGKVAVIPVREDDPASILSFATIRDRGVYAGTVSSQFRGAVSNRDIVNSREFVLVTNPIGLILNFENVTWDLGPIEVIDAV